jgi:transposase
LKQRTLLAERDAALADRDAQIAQLTSDLKTLTEQVKRMLAGRSRQELIAAGQEVLFPETPLVSEEAPAEEDEAPDGETAGDRIERRHRPKSAARKIDTSALPRVERVHELPPEDRFCPETGLPLVAVGEKVFDEISYERARLFIVHHVQIVYGVTAEVAIERQVSPRTAPMPARPLEGCAASAELLARTLVQKYAAHLPLYRQEEIFARDGLRLPRQTMCDWVLGAADVLQPIADRLMASIRAGPVSQLDDTPVMCQGGKGKKHFQAYLWTFVNPQVMGVAYRFTPGRSSDLIADQLEGIEGYLVGDGYSGNKAAAKKVSGEIVMVGCWAHTTRKFRDALCEAPATAQLFRDGIKQLYAIEAEATDAGLDDEARASLRQEKSRDILATLLARGRRLRNKYSDAGKMAKAIGYMLNQRKPLRRFLESGLLPLDNNRCERSIRPIAIGRRNWLFAGSVRGGHAAATIYTLVESCRLAKVDPESYLADVLVRVATHPATRIDQLLPHSWEQPAKQATSTNTSAALLA